MWKECRDHYAKEEKVYRELKKELKRVQISFPLCG
jgi:hypothetical protein